MSNESHSASNGARVGCDIGGTFTDIILQLPGGRLHINKTSTTAGDPGKAVVAGIRMVLEQARVSPASISEIVHGTTTASNTILQRAGARTGVLTTRGFRDVLEIGRIRTPTMFDVSWTKPEPLAPRRFRREIDERIGADGSVVRAIDPEQVRAEAAFFLAEGVEAIAICFINSYVNPVHELAAKAILEAEYPSLLITASCDVLPEMKEYERTSTTVVNAYILPAMRRYLAQLRLDLEAIGVRAPIQVMASNGGMMGITAASSKPVFAVASGPAGGVTGAARIGVKTGDRDLIVFDMGGTTAKASIIEAGEPSLTNEYEFRDGISSPSRFVKGGGYVLKVPSIDIAEVGAGGGSVALIDAGGLLRVGPESVGSFPGPACYQLGNKRPTVTDANMVLGYLNPQALAGGSLGVDPALARKAVADLVGMPLGLSLLDAAHGIREVANVNMARAIRAVTVERGRDPRDMTLMAFGGSGPVHAVDVAKLLGVRRVVAPVMAGVFCAAGMLAADAERDFLRAVLRRLDQCSVDTLQACVDDLRRQGLIALAAEGYGPSHVTFVLKADLRYAGQSSDLTIPLAGAALDAQRLAALRADFQRTYAETFGYSNDEPLELVNLRLSVRGHRDDRLVFSSIRVDAPALTVVGGARQASFARGGPLIDTPVLPRTSLGTTPRAGPLILEAYDTTIVVPPGTFAWADDIGNVILDIAA
ncbi:MAG: hydantoinase/oxoprolinase family protein [Betaproteobacteria bacterium]|nr:hydantoinase/oxoprolinase family protein [Betaproteobacteria bacterium]